jgi:hypothetical protein
MYPTLMFCNHRSRGMVSELYGMELLQPQQPPSSDITQSVIFVLILYCILTSSQWFGTYNYLEETLPIAHTVFQTLMRRAFIGFVASVVSDTISNSLRVVKTYRQVNEIRIGYWAAAKAVIAVDGVQGLFGRGLKTRILANGLQGLMFSVLWKFFMDL